MTFTENSKKILHLGIPMLTSRLVGMLVVLIAIAMIAQLGHNVLAATAIAFSIFITAAMMGYGIIYAVGIIAGKAYGADEPRLVGQIVRYGFVVTLLVTVPVVTLFWNIDPLLHLFHQKPVLVPIIENFLRAVSLCIFPNYLFTLLTQYVVAVSKPRIVTTTTLISGPIAVFVFYCLIFGHFGMPALGLWGMGIGFMLWSLLQSAILFIYIATVTSFKPYRLFSRYKPTLYWGKHIVDIFKLGFPMALQYGGEIAAFTASTFLLGLFNTDALVAQQVSNQLVLLALMIPFTLSEAISILNSQAIGAKQTHEIKGYAYHGCILIVLLYSVMVMPLVVFPRFFMSFYIDIHNTARLAAVHLTTVFIFITAVTILFDSIRNTMTGALRGLFDANVPMVIGISVLWGVGLPTGYLLAFTWHMGPVGIKWGYCFAILLGAIILIKRFMQQSQKLETT